MRAVGRLSLALLGTAVGCVVALHVIRPGVSPVERRLSVYALGPFGWLMDIAFAATAAGLSALAIVVRCSTGRPRLVPAGLVVAAGALVLSAVYRLDAVDRTDEVIHRWASGTAAMAVLVAAVGWSVVGAGRPHPWRRGPDMPIALVAFALAVVSPILHETFLTGINQRLVWVALLAWCVLVTIRELAAGRARGLIDGGSQRQVRHRLSRRGESGRVGRGQGPVVAVLVGATAGSLVAACSESHPASERDVQRSAAEQAGLSWSEPIEVATGDASRGPWRMNDSEFRYVDDPSVAIDARGRMLVAWTDQVDQDVFIQVYDPAGAAIFEVPVNVSRSPDILSWLPRISTPVDQPGRVYVAWQELVFSGSSHGGEIFFARSTDGGRTFDAPTNLSRTAAGAGKGRLSPESWHNGSLDLAVGTAGDVHVAWSEYQGALRYRRSVDGGVTFARTVHVAGGTRAPTRGPTLALERGGAIHLAWTFGEDPTAGVQLATSSDGGRSFGAPSVVTASDGHADAPKLIVAGDGTLHLAYAETPRESPDRSAVHYTRRPVGQHAFETPRTISLDNTGDVGHAGFPSLAVDGDSNVYVVWERFAAGEHRPFGLGFAHSSDGGRTFGPGTVVPGTTDSDLGTNGGLQGLLMRKLAVGVDGTIAVVNSSFDQNKGSQIRLLRGRLRPLGPHGSSRADQVGR